MTSLLDKISTRQLIFAGSLLTLIYALFSQGVYHLDEHYQILEYAHMRLFGSLPENLAWEYSLGMRPGLQPLVAWGVGRVLVALGLYNPFVMVGTLQVLSGLLSVSVFLFFYRTVKEQLNERQGKWMLILGFFLWFLAYLHVHFNAEMLSGNLLLLLLSLTLRCRKADNRCEFGWGVLLGLTAGALFAIRFQMGFALLGYGIWLLLFNRNLKLYAGMVLGVVVMLAVGFAADCWLYGEWTFTPWNYLRENILNNHMIKFGSEPWWYYITASILDGGILFGLLILVSVVWFFRRHPHHVITWTLVPFLLVHFFMAHKELRFLFPVLMLTPYLIVELVGVLPRRVMQARTWLITVWVMVVMNVGAMVYCLTQTTPDIYFYKMMRTYCAQRQEVVALNLATENSYYSRFETIIAPRVVVARFYMSENLESLYFDTSEELEASARQLMEQGKQVLLCSTDSKLEQKSGLTLRKIVWMPYPDFVVRYFNFNDWTRFCVHTKNVYEVISSNGERAVQ